MGRNYIPILALIVMVFFSGMANAYPAPVDFDGSILRWNIANGDAPIYYEIVATREEDLTDFEDSIDESAAIWSSVPNSYFRYEKAEANTGAQVTINLERAIDGGSISAGYAIFDEYQDKKPSHCAIHILIEDALSDFSIAKTILHELGHCLGLGHSVIPEAIMSYRLDKNQFGLDIDDEAAVSRLYPIDGSKPQLPPGCSIALKRAESQSAGMMLLLLPLFMLGITRLQIKRPLGLHLRAVRNR